MKAAERKALEKVFAAEVEGRLPFQSKAAIYKQLEAEGLVRFDKETFGRDCFGGVEVKGWYLTHAGRLAYCLTC